MHQATGTALSRCLQQEASAIAAASERLDPGQVEAALALLTSPHVHDFGQGPRQLILIPTAPVPVGGGLLFVEPSRVKPVPTMGVDDLAKLYVTMGTLTGAEAAK